MKIVFFGSSDFAVSSLRMLLDSKHKVLAVVTQPDRKRGRNLKVSATPVNDLASSKNISVYQPENVGEKDFLKRLKSFSADLFVVVAFGQILPGEVLGIPKRYSLNLHASLLPKYRGAAPINRAIINGETKTGLTIIRMNERMDAGDIVLQRKVEIEREDTSESLRDKLSELGAILLLDAVRFIEEDRIDFKKQDEKKVTLAPKMKKEDGAIDWNTAAVEIQNRIRGVIPWPGAYTYLGDKRINIWKATAQDGTANPAEIVEAEKELIVGTKKGFLKVEEIQAEGKRRMGTEEFLRGYQGLNRGDTFGH
ncbi:MAG: methionyl-tRNA formyltransferase [Candidatus Omnitrophica bacterium]|nr:methionyl-tRNA formyltransferase [Candidatus Omnitrophota bacterium]